MGIRDFFDGRFFDTRYKTKIHIAQVALMALAIILTIWRMAMPGFKSLIIIGYQLLTTHKERFKKWASLKANAILNTMEIVFWFVAFGLLCQANGRFCTGGSCALSWIVTLIVMVLIVLAFQTSVVSIKDYRYWKHFGINRETEIQAAYPKPQV
ncbi:hypothetical protein HER10_EVM0002432 [Colletotrichum scovillei]|uniref:Cytochrome P450 protein n=1 Tax=Colletotrichum scovillei TaxID=1209932 RepID=A0A9P7RL18_9PEZI|nr:uncharacterized protein HER10_EVM0002432 [Colletotrichum scovillei]KAF4777483.1 hypothetical protein HER10_EVM0002432 [Colletotrichum scovillei]KAG7059533.1 cytochrome P450 protein [Colletotrichum scovillei]KAG7085251.1 cytochrome P450 protein [Colletotrichum scovillei]